MWRVCVQTGGRQQAAGHKAFVGPVLCVSSRSAVPSELNVLPGHQEGQGGQAVSLLLKHSTVSGVKGTGLYVWGKGTGVSEYSE